MFGGDSGMPMWTERRKTVSQRLLEIIVHRDYAAEADQRNDGKKVSTELPHPKLWKNRRWSKRNKKKKKKKRHCICARVLLNFPTTVFNTQLRCKCSLRRKGGVFLPSGLNNPNCVSSLHECAF